MADDRAQWDDPDRNGHDQRRHRDRPGDADRDADDRGRADEEEQDEDGEGSDDGPPIYKRPIFWIIGGVVLVVLVVGGLLYWLHARKYESTDDAYIDAHIVRVAAQVAGKLVEVPVRDNRHVAPGTLLAEIEPYASEAERAQTLAGVAQAQAQLKQAEAQVAQAHAARAQASQNSAASAASAGKAAADYRRYLALARIDPAAEAASQLDAAKAQAASTAAQASAAQRDIESAAANIKAAEQQADAARAEVEAAEARVAQSNVAMAHLSIVAPIAGQVVDRSVNRGSYVQPGTQLMAIVPDRMWVTANFKETQLKLIRPGQHVDIKVDAFPGVDFTGHVDSIQRGAGQAFALLPPQNATGNYVKVVQRVPVRILFDHPDPHRWPIGPGMSVSPSIRVR